MILNSPFNQDSQDSLKRQFLDEKTYLPRQLGCAFYKVFCFILRIRTLYKMGSNCLTVVFGLLGVSIKWKTNLLLYPIHSPGKVATPAVSGSPEDLMK